MSDSKFSISTETILRIVVILLALGFIYWIRDVLALFFVAIILSSAFDPLIDWLQARKIPRGISIIGVYILFFAVLGGAIYLLIDPIATQIRELSRAFPDLYYKVNHGLQSLGAGIDKESALSSVNTGLADITRSLTQASSSLFNFITSVFGGIVSFLMVLVITFYLTIEENGMKRFVGSVTPLQHRPYVLQLMSKMQQRMGYWLRGQLILSLVIFVLTYIGLTAMGIKYALILALLAGIFEIIPFLGPWISAVPAVFVAFTISPFKALLVAILYLVIQQLENNLIVPRVMGKSTGLNPLVVILSILAGARIGGIVGALLAVPVATAVSVYLEGLMEGRRNQENRLEK